MPELFYGRIRGLAIRKWLLVPWTGTIALMSDIDSLLNADPSRSVAQQLIEWATETRSQIARGDLMLGILTSRDVAKIPIAYERAAEFGRFDAWLMLAWWYANPDFGHPDLQGAEAALKLAIDAKVANAQVELAKIRWFFKRDTATPDEKREACRALCDLVRDDPGNAEAVHVLGLLTTQGFGVAESPTTGFQLQQRAASLGNADAMFELYFHHANGLGVPADEKAALDACQRAAAEGHSRAMYNLGAFNAAGRGMPKNTAEAVKWYERAADAGNPSALVGLAVIYATGDGIEADREYARQLLDQADYCGLDVSEVRRQFCL